MFSDFRLPGGTTHSNIEEIEAQHRMGTSTTLVQLNSGLARSARAIHPLIVDRVRTGRARWSKTSDPHRANLAVIRHPAAIKAAISEVGPVEIDHLVVVVNSAPVDWAGREHYRPEELHDQVGERFGVAPQWAPVGPKVRAAIADRVPAEHLRGQDWHNIVDVDHWWVDRSGRDRDARPVVGRHSRPSPQKWPQRAEREVVYPTDGRWHFRVLGWGPDVEAFMGGVPDHWDVLPFDAMSPRDFLAELDFFVYYHHPNLVEAFGRTILEAIASGLPAVLPPHFEPLFGPSALYAEPEGVRDLVDALWSDPSAYHAHVTSATAVVRRRFGYEGHAERLMDYLGAECVGSPDRASMTSSAAQAQGSGRGDGVIAVCGSSQDSLRSSLVEGLEDVKVRATLTVAREHPQKIPAQWTETVPSQHDLGMPSPAWGGLVAAREETLINASGITAVVYADKEPPGSQVIEVVHRHGGSLWWFTGAPRDSAAGAPAIAAIDSAADLRATLAQRRNTQGPSIS